MGREYSFALSFSAGEGATIGGEGDVLCLAGQEMRKKFILLAFPPKRSAIISVPISEIVSVSGPRDDRLWAARRSSQGRGTIVSRP